MSARASPEVLGDLRQPRGQRWSSYIATPRWPAGNRYTTSLDATACHIGESRPPGDNRSGNLLSSFERFCTRSPA